MPSKKEYLDRIAMAAGARQWRESHPKKKSSRRRAQGWAGELLACGCVPEDEVQKALIQWDRETGSRFRLWWTRSERKESRRLSSWAEARGARRGVPDLICLGLPGVALELKAKCKKHVLSSGQRKRIEQMIRDGWIVPVANGLEQAIEKLEAVWASR